MSRWLVLDIAMPNVLRPFRRLILSSFDKENLRTMDAIKKVRRRAPRRCPRQLSQSKHQNERTLPRRSPRGGPARVTDHPTGHATQKPIIRAWLSARSRFVSGRLALTRRIRLPFCRGGGYLAIVITSPDWFIWRRKAIPALAELTTPSGPAIAKSEASVVPGGGSLYIFPARAHPHSRCSSSRQAQCPHRPAPGRKAAHRGSSASESSPAKIPVTDSWSFRQVARHRVPHDVEIDIDLAAAHPIGMPVITRHGTSGCPVRTLIAYAPCRFPGNLYPVKHRAVQQFAGVQARPVVLDVAPDPVDRGHDVRQRFTVVSHKATASARTRSRMRAFSPRGVATST